jgi:putative flavoprotein involved in K+ transport
VGSAQSGCQIAEDMASAGRKVYLSTSPVGRVPRRYRGKDIVDWLLMMDFYNLPTETVTDPAVLAAKVPLVSGIGQHGHTLSLQWLSEQGVVILGKMENADGNTIYFKNNAHEHVKFGDAFSKKIKETVDDFVKKNNILTPDPENDPADLPDVNSLCASAITSVSLKNLDINTIIWTTGFTGDFSYLKVPAFDIEGNPRHKEGLTAIRGMYFIGLPWQRMRKSGIIFGIADDAEFIAGKVVNDLN